MEERRALQRFEMELPVRVSRKTDCRENIMLRTFNISSQGAFIGTDQPFPVGTRLDMDVFLINGAGSKDDVISTHGEVVRTGPTGMAVRFDDKYRILPVEYHPEQ